MGVTPPELPAPEGALIGALRHHGPQVTTDMLSEVLPWRDYAASHGLCREGALHEYLQIGLRRARRAGFQVSTDSGDRMVARTSGWVRFDGQEAWARFTPVTDIDGVYRALIRAVGPVSFRFLARQLDAGWEEVVHEGGRSLVADMPMGSREVARLGAAVAEVVRDVARARSITVDYHMTVWLPDEWFIVPTGVSRKGFGTAGEYYDYRVNRGELSFDADG